MTTRREFLAAAGAGLTALMLNKAAAQETEQHNRRVYPATLQMQDDLEPAHQPLVISTWRHGLAANLAAWELLKRGGRALDAAEAGVRVSEADPEVTSVGYGGRPDRDGCVTLDACCMDEKGNAGSVAFLQDILHPISVARKVMEETPHVMLVGQGAQRFALEQGFKKQNLLTEKARQDWQEWKKTSEYKPWTPASNPAHDTIGLLALDAAGDLSGCCTTSGLAYKMHGRVGDSPIIGAALFVDNEVGAACATGVGEEVMKTVGSFLIVELMRQGLSPAQACCEAIGRIVHKNPQWREVQVGYLAVDKTGKIGAFSLQQGFQYALTYEGSHELLDAEHWDG